MIKSDIYIYGPYFALNADHVYSSAKLQPALLKPNEKRYNICVLFYALSEEHFSGLLCAPR